MQVISNVKGRLLNFTAMSGVMVAAAGLPMAAQAQSTSAASADGNTIIVTGSRARTTEEIAQKQGRDVISDSLSQDEIGSVPDFNVADALRRIAGVVTEFDEDEGRFVNIRGIDANLNYVTFDGVGVPTTGNFGGSGRNVNIEFFPSTAVKRLDVYKTFTPDLDGSSIGGYVNVVTRSAFDADGLFFIVRGTVSHYTADDIAEEQDGVRLPFRIESTLSTKFGADDEFGFVATGLYSQRPREQDRLFTVGGFENRFDNVVPPTRFDSSLTSNNQERYGGQAKFEYQNDNFYGSLSGYFYRQQENETRFRNNLLFTAGTVTETGVDEANAATARMELNFDYFPIRTQGKGVQAHFEGGSDQSRFNFDIGWAEQNFDHDTPALVFRTPFVPQLGVSVDASDVVPTRSTFADPSYFSDPANYDLSFIRERDLNTDEEVFNALADYGWNAERGDQGFGVKVGASYRRLERARDNDEFRFSGSDFATFRDASSLAPLLAGDQFQSGFSPDNFLFYDIDAARAFVEGANIPRDEGRSNSDDFSYEEDILAAFGMATYRTDRLDLIAGVRFETTDFTSTSRNEPLNTVDGNFDHFLPSVNASYELSDGLYLRAAYSRTLGRPNPGDLTQTFSVTSATDAMNDEGLAQINRGNPDLEPREADNFDLSLEYYFLRGEGLLSAAIFRKDIEGDIFASRTVGTYTGQDFPDDEVFSGDQVVFVQRQNASASMVQGLELQAYLGSMPFLPAPLDNLGISANAAILDGEMTLANGLELDSRIRQADFTANLSLFYNTDKFEARIAYNYADAFPIGLSETAGFTRVDDSFEQIDASLRYYLSDNFVLSVEGRNLTESRRRQLTGSNLDLLFGETILGRQFHFGVTYRY
jgi:iron complex outermembrane recepter protein